MSADASPADTLRAQTLERVFDAVRANDIAVAKVLAGEALAKGYEHPLLLNLRALEHEEQGRLEQSLKDLRRAHFLAPTDFSILNACGLCLARMNRPEEALQCYNQAIGLRPDFAPAIFNSGWALEQLGEVAKADQAYRRAVELTPQSAQAWANIAWLAARRGDAAEARLNAEKALALQPGHPTAILALANVELDQPLVAEQLLRTLLADPRLGPYDSAVAYGQLGDVLDALDRPTEAFAAYKEGNDLFRTEAAPRFEGKGQQTAAGSLAWLCAWAEAISPLPPTAATALRSSTGERAHIFLLGFPRTGTTLVETVLGAHPDVKTLEERSTFNAAVRTFMTDAGTLSRLEALSDKELQPYRDDYWQNVAAFGGEPGGKIFIDKNPFNTNKLPLIRKLFPGAKVLFAIRDPRDVVLSCFRRRFNLNASTYELLDLQRAASLYDRTMRFAELLRQKRPIAELQLVYERLVEDLEGEARAACAFIGADWRPEMMDIAARGRRGDVASASSAQISRGLYDGAGQWRRYAEALAPVMPTLAPWIERFGYSAT